MTDRHAIAMRPRPKVKRFVEKILDGPEQVVRYERADEPSGCVHRVNPFVVIERLARDTSINKDDRLDMIWAIAREAQKGEKT